MTDQGRPRVLATFSKETLIWCVEDAERGERAARQQIQTLLAALRGLLDNRNYSTVHGAGPSPAALAAARAAVAEVAGEQPG